MKEIVYTSTAKRALQRIPRNIATVIRAKITQYAENPSSLAANVVKLQGQDGYRLRVGNWRVIFDEDRTILTIEDIGPRSSIYG